MRRVLELIIGVVVAIAPVQASIIVTLDNPTQAGLPGDTLTFAGSIKNTGDTEIFLNGDTLTFSGDLVNFSVLDNFFANAPISVAAGDTALGIDLFDIQISPSFAAAFGAYPGSYFVVGGIDGDGQEVLDTVQFTVNINEPVADAPEPATLGLAVLALGFVWSRKRLAR